MRLLVMLEVVGLLLACNAFIAECQLFDHRISPLTNKNPMENLLSSAKHIDEATLESYGEIYQQIKNKFRSREWTVEAQHTTCARSIETMFNFSNPQVLQMWDSWGKLESGILKGNLMWEGRYFECNSVKNPVEGYNGRACSVTIGKLPTSLAPSTSLSVGVCFPNSCTQNNISQMFSGIMSALNITTSVEINCFPEQQPWDAKNIIAVFTTCVFGLVVIFGTAYEIYQKRKTRFVPVDDDVPLLNAAGEDNNINPGFFSKIISSFSIMKNTKAFLSTEKREGNIHCLHGMRFISMTWVVLGHTFLIPLTISDNAVDIANYVLNHFSFMAIASGTFSVDTFFFLSGLLAAFLGLREMTKHNGKINIPMMYLGRYLRLTPVYAYMILLSVTILLMVGDGPFWNAAGMTTACKDYWWTNLLYINNLYPVSMGAECVGWGWYLANDMQFYLVCPFFLILLYRKPKIGVGALIFGTICSIAITGTLSSYYGLMAMTSQLGMAARLIAGHPYVPPQHIPAGNATATQADVLASDIYAKPWCRIGVYFIGMITGYILHTTKGQIKMNKLTVILGWTVAAVMELALVYGLYGHLQTGDYMNYHAAAFYNAVSRPLWAVGLGWVVIACVTGHGGIVNDFLSWKAFIPLSRLTYCCYLIHIPILELLIMTQEVQLHFSVLAIVTIFLAAIILSNGLGYLMSMLVEIPMGGVQNTIFPKKHKDRTEVSPDEINSVTESNFKRS